MTNWVRCMGGNGGAGGNYDEIPLTLIPDTYIDRSTGAESPYNGWSSTDYIDVSSISDFYMCADNASSGQNYNAFYTENQVFISAFSMAGHITIPATARYMRLSQTTSFMGIIKLFAEV